MSLKLFAHAARRNMLDNYFLQNFKIKLSLITVWSIFLLSLKPPYSLKIFFSNIPYHNSFFYFFVQTINLILDKEEFH